MTLRPLEAAYLGKKLITTNSQIRNIQFYDPSWSFVLGNEPDRRLRDFLRSHYQPISTHRYNQIFSVDRFLKDFGDA